MSAISGTFLNLTKNAFLNHIGTCCEQRFRPESLSDHL